MSFRRLLAEQYLRADVSRIHLGRGRRGDADVGRSWASLLLRVGAHVGWHVGVLLHGALFVVVVLLLQLAETTILWVRSLLLLLLLLPWGRLVRLLRLLARGLSPGGVAGGLHARALHAHGRVVRLTRLLLLLLVVLLLVLLGHLVTGPRLRHGVGIVVLVLSTLLVIMVSLLVLLLWLWLLSILALLLVLLSLRRSVSHALLLLLLPLLLWLWLVVVALLRRPLRHRKDQRLRLGPWLCAGGGRARRLELLRLWRGLSATDRAGRVWGIHEGRRHEARTRTCRSGDAAVDPGAVDDAAAAEPAACAAGSGHHRLRLRGPANHLVLIVAEVLLLLVVLRLSVRLLLARGYDAGNAGSRRLLRPGGVGCRQVVLRRCSRGGLWEGAEGLGAAVVYGLLLCLGMLQLMLRRLLRRLMRLAAWREEERSGRWASGGGCGAERAGAANRGHTVVSTSGKGSYLCLGLCQTVLGPTLVERLLRRCCVAALRRRRGTNERERLIMRLLLLRCRDWMKTRV